MFRLLHFAITARYSTFCALAGVSPAGPGPAPLESLNLWPYLSGAAGSSPRTSIVHDHRMFTNETTGAIRVGEAFPCVVFPY